MHMAVANTWSFREKLKQRKNPLALCNTIVHLSNTVHTENILLIGVIISYSEVQDLITINLIKTDFFLLIT